jgi:hypothetical protein
MSEYLNKQIQAIQRLGSLKQLSPEDRQRIAAEALGSFQINLDYLQRIGKLPPEFIDFNFENYLK